MSDRDDHGRSAAPPPERFLSAFSGPAPLTTAEVAEALAVAPSTARAKLATLRDAGRVGRRDLAAGEETVTVWYPTRATLEARQGPAAVSRDDVAATLATMEFPGASEMMRDWRRDAVRAAYEHLEEHGEATDAGLTEAVYPAHSAGYDDPAAWLDCVRPRLRRLPGVVPEEDRWLFTG